MQFAHVDCSNLKTTPASAITSCHNSRWIPKAADHYCNLVILKRNMHTVGVHLVHEASSSSFQAV